MQRILYDTKDRNYKIFNEFKKMFDGHLIPTCEQLTHMIKKKIKLSPELLELIFKDNFKNITAKSSTIHIIKHYYNTTFNKKIIKVKTNNNGVVIKQTADIDGEIEKYIDYIEIVIYRKIYNDDTEGDQTAEETINKDFLEYEEKKEIKEDSDCEELTTNEDY